MRHGSRAGTHIGRGDQWAGQIDRFEPVRSQNGLVRNPTRWSPRNFGDSKIDIVAIATNAAANAAASLARTGGRGVCWRTEAASRYV